MKTYFEFASAFPASLTLSVGQEAGQVERHFAELQEHMLGSVVLGRRKVEALEELDATFCDSCAPGWDGYDACGASYDSYLRTRSFLNALPTNLPAPEVALDPDGEVSLEWHRSPGRVFSVSVGGNDALHYAGKFGPSTKIHGTEVFANQIPQVILDSLRRLWA